MANGNVVTPYLAKIKKVPATFVDEAADVFIRVAQRNGGTMMGKRLTARTAGRSVSDDSGKVDVYGTPAGPWAMRESGARAHGIVPARGGALAGGLRHPVSVPVRHPGFGGERTWTHTVEQASGEIDRLAADLAARAAS